MNVGRGIFPFKIHVAMLRM